MSLEKKKQYNELLSWKKSRLNLMRFWLVIRPVVANSVIVFVAFFEGFSVDLGEVLRKVLITIGFALFLALIASRLYYLIFAIAIFLIAYSFTVDLGHLFDLGISSFSVVLVLFEKGFELLCWLFFAMYAFEYKKASKKLLSFNKKNV